MEDKLKTIKKVEKKWVMLREKNNRWIENTWYIPKKISAVSRKSHSPNSVTY